MSKGCVIWLTGLPCSGKTTAASALETKLRTLGIAARILDGDIMRQGLSRDLGFSEKDRRENIRRVADLAGKLADGGIIGIVALVSPFLSARDDARQIVGAARFLEVFMSADLRVCELRDSKKMYARARSGDIPNFTGVSSPYEPPEHPDLMLDTAVVPPEQSGQLLLDLLRHRGFIS